MSKKRDPIVAVLNYFQQVDLLLAEQALALAKEIVRARRPTTRASTMKAKAKPRTTEPLAPMAS
jgi:hypothetical protein